MPDPDHDAESEPRTDPRFDNWPVQRYDAYGDVTVERETPETSEGEPERMDDVEWVGIAPSGAGSGSAFLYEPENDTIHQGRFDRQNQRIVVDEESESRELDEEETLGDHLAEIGDDHGWDWLSSFARDHLETHEHGEGHEEVGDGYHLPPGFDLEHSAFQQRNLADSADVDAAFFGSHTFSDDTGRVHVLEREIGVDAEESADRTRATVEERYLVAEGPREEERAGDAELVDEWEYELAVDADPDQAGWENHTEGLLQEWHERHYAPPEREEHRQVNRDEFTGDAGGSDAQTRRDR